MFIAEKLLYLELQKTGGTHILRLLQQYTDGRLDGKHNRLQQLHEGKAVIGSIRNPWDWYVSLWAYGAGGKGAIRARTAKKIDLDYYYRMLPKAMGKNWLGPGEFVRSLSHDMIKPVRAWQSSYADSNDVLLFRRWLSLMLDRRRRYDIGEGYAFSPLSRHAGLMTYRYFRLFTLGDRIYHDRQLSDPDYLAEYDERHGIASAIIRTESLEQDFVAALQQVGVQLDAQQQSAILNKEGGKTNTSRRRPAADYYDDASIALVAKADAYLIDKYGYQPPV